MTEAKKSPFGAKSKDDGKFMLPGIGEVDMNPFYVPPGTYAATCTGATEGKSNTGNTKIVFSFAISKAMEVAEPDPKAVGKDLKIHASITPGAMWKVRQTLDGLGVSYAGDAVDLKACTGKKCVITVVDSMFNGEKGSDIKKVRLTGKGK